MASRVYRNAQSVEPGHTLQRPRPWNAKYVRAESHSRWRRHCCGSRLSAASEQSGLRLECIIALGTSESKAYAAWTGRCSEGSESDDGALQKESGPHVCAKLLFTVCTARAGSAVVVEYRR